MTQSTTPTDTAEDPTLAAAIRKVAWRLLPFLVLMYIISFIDRTNIGYAKTAYQADTGFSDAVFALGAGIFFIGYAAFELPSNLIMQRVGAKIWLARIMVTWGIFSALTFVAHNEYVFYLLRFLLGVAEAGFFPGVLLYLSRWFPNSFRARATAIFYFAIPIALAFGSIVSGALLGMDGVLGWAGWQWMFFIEGAIAVVVGVIAYYYITNEPHDATWLTHDEKAALIAELAREERAKLRAGSHAVRGRLRDLLTNPTILCYAAVFFFIQISVYGLIFYLPSIVESFLDGASSLKVGLVGSIPWLLSIVGCYLIAMWSDRTGSRRNLVIVSFALMGVALAASRYVHPVLCLLALTVAAAMYMGATPVFWTLPAEHLTRDTNAAGIAVITALGNTGGFVAPILKTKVEQSSGAIETGMVAMGISAAIAALIVWLTERRNTRTGS